MMSTEGPGTNTGHGHVWIRPDGAKARCGGPAICSECAKDAARWGSDLMDTQDEERFLNKPRSLDDAPTDALIAELGRRGYVSRPKDGWAGITPQGDRNAAPEDEWLEVYRHVWRTEQENFYNRMGHLQWGVMKLYELLEPPSVRERRLNGG